MSYTKTITTVEQTLNQTFSELDNWFDRQPRDYKPHDGGWTVDEILEHITLTSHFLMIVIRKGVEKSLKRASSQAITGDESDLAKMQTIGENDSFVWTRPEHMEPTHTKSSSEIRSIMKNQWQECLTLLHRLEDGAGELHKVRMSVQDLGKLDMYQWLYFLALHAQRHIAQIESVWAEGNQI